MSAAQRKGHVHDIILGLALTTMERKIVLNRIYRFDGSGKGLKTPKITLKGMQGRSHAETTAFGLTLGSWRLEL